MTASDFANYLPEATLEPRVTGTGDLGPVEFHWHVLKLLCAIGEQVARMNERIEKERSAQ